MSNEIKELIDRLRTDSLDATEASLSIMDLCMEAAEAIENLDAQLDVCVQGDAEAQAEITGYRVLGTLEHLRGLVEAERDGRLAVLPCKVGDTVYILSKNREVKGMEVKYIRSAPDGAIYMQAECKDETEGCNCDGPCGIRFSAGNMAQRHIFLTREEAEAALKGES